MRALAAALALVTTAAAAETVVPPAVFEAENEGRTLIFEDAGGFYGAERYLPGRRVIWQDIEGDCMRGTWFPLGEQMCFTYEPLPIPQCWVVLDSGGQRRVRPVGSDGSRDVMVAGASSEPLACPLEGPGV